MHVLFLCLLVFVVACGYLFLLCVCSAGLLVCCCLFLLVFLLVLVLMFMFVLMMFVVLGLLGLVIGGHGDLWLVTRQPPPRPLLRRPPRSDRWTASEASGLPPRVRCAADGCPLFCFD